MSRRQFYRYLWQANLWEQVDRSRLCDMMVRAMDEAVLEQLCEHYRGKSVEEIESDIVNSKHLPNVPDPAQLAQFIFARCEG